MADDDKKPEEAEKAAPEEKKEDAPATEEAKAPAEEKAEAPDTPKAEAEAKPDKDDGEEAKPAVAAEGDAKEGEAKEGEGAPKKDDGKPKDIFAELAGEEEGAPKVLKAKGSKNIATGIVHVKATFNNTMITITDTAGNTIGWSTSGKMGFRGSRKSTAYAAQVVCQDACRQAMSHGLKEVEVRVKGPGTGRESAVRAVQNIGINVTKITDVTPIPHNGCRPKKARRV